MLIAFEPSGFFHPVGLPRFISALAFVRLHQSIRLAVVLQPEAVLVLDGWNFDCNCLIDFVGEIVGFGWIRLIVLGPSWVLALRFSWFGRVHFAGIVAGV